MSAPLVVNLTDGSVWTRRGARRSGEALYALADVCSCPEFVMATLAELAEHGIAGSADVLPVPVGTKTAADQEAAAITVFRASHDSIAMGLYTTSAAARAHCEAEERRTWASFEELSFDWIEDEEDGVAELTVWVGGEECTTGYVVTALDIASEYDEEANE